MIVDDDGNIVELSPTTPVVEDARSVVDFNRISEEASSDTKEAPSRHNVVTSSSNEIHSEASSSTLSAEEELPTHGNTKYAGDVIDNSPPLDPSGFTLNSALPFKTSAQLVAMFDKSVNSGMYTIWPWQIDISNDLCLKPGTYKEPNKVVLVAANGSGKDAFVIAPFAVWFALTKMKSRCIITSSSGQQLTIQTEAYIKNLCQKVNEFFGQEYFRIRQRHIKCRLTGSEIRMFATDEAGKAEGYHPIEPGAEMAIIVNEGKSVSEEIHQALRRCTGYTHWLEASSPGEPQGFLYRVFTDPRLNFIPKQITSYDCPHISEREREEDKVTFGEHSSFYRSKHLALFTSLGGDVIIPSDVVEQLLSAPPQLVFPSWPKRVGIDLAAGGDESVLVITQGARLLKEYFCREQDTTLTADWLESKLLENGISKQHEFIFADDGGVGRAIIDNLVRRGWQIKRILNQSPAILKRQYGNRGAELWYNVKRIIEERLFDITSCSRIMLDQLVTRKNKTALQGARVFLEAKREAKAAGRPSPDRADAFILSFTGLTIENFLADGQKSSNIDSRPKVTLTPAELEAWHDNHVTYQNRTDKLVLGKSKRIFGSLNSAVNRNN